MLKYQIEYPITAIIIRIITMTTMLPVKCALSNHKIYSSDVQKMASASGRLIYKES